MARIFINLSESDGIPRIVGSVALAEPVAALTRKRGTIQEDQVQFIRDNAVVDMSAYTLRFMVKEDGKYDAEPLVQLAGDSWVYTDILSGVFVGSVDFNTTALNTLMLSPDGNANNDVPVLTAMGAFSWTLGSEIAETEEFPVIIPNKVVTGTETDFAYLLAHTALPLFWLTNPAEILSISDGAFPGSVIGNFTTFTGTVDLSLNFLTVCKFPLLATCSGSLNLGSNNIAAAYFPELRTLSGTLGFLDNPLTLLTFTRLATISGSLDLGGCTTITSASFPALTTLSGALYLNGCGFNAAALDALFIALASTITTGGGTLNLTSQSPSAAPTSASAAARTYLAGKSITVTY